MFAQSRQRDIPDPVVDRCVPGVIMSLKHLFHPSVIFKYRSHLISVEKAVIFGQIRVDVLMHEDIRFSAAVKKRRYIVRKRIISVCPVGIARHIMFAAYEPAGVEEYHMLFTTETRAEVMKTIYAYRHGTVPKENIRRIK